MKFQFVDHIVSKDGLEDDASKTEAIQNFEYREIKLKWNRFWALNGIPEGSYPSLQK